ncbi:MULTISPECIES: choline/ethanolamine kinase family protein [Nonomuraea]|uniref:Phosphotransferase family protein n=1 Tax=Nonomuraea ferruginea TaxID=46174 RepID=A0ABT4T666_9ACTN|nr:MULTISPECIES: choline/ethanolamine kinase family protein [Nonomuraea]MDA0644643.1 phosphotransferase family protein [Nonomuraea ferruginea]TXK41789.1 phosphotransferase family protein [Nonomuraea sp. C10]
MAVLEILDRIPLLSGVPRSVEELPGGLTNRNFKVTTDGGTFVVRVFGGDGSLLFIDRDAEHLATLAAAEAGVGAPVHAYLPGEGLVVGYIPGRTFTEADVRDPANLPRLAETCRRLHAGPRFPREFDMFDVQRRYLGIVRERGFRLPARYLEFMPQVAQIQKCLEVRREATVPCNNDLLAGNIIDDGQRLWLIDYEYAGNNDPCFELGNLWSESDLSPGQLEELVTAYYGRRLRHKIARARLLGLMAKYGWTLWASIQDGADQPIDFDFWSWGMEKYERAVAEFTGAELPSLMDEAARAD